MGQKEEISIRKAYETDLSQILLIMGELASELPRDLFVPSTPREIKDAILNKNSFILVAEKEENVCGGCIIIKPNKKNHYFDLATPSECVIFDSLFLISACRGLDIAPLLIQKALETIRTEYKSAKYVYCSINNKNVKSLKTMTKAGFSYFATKNLYGGLSREVFFLEL